MPEGAGFGVLLSSAWIETTLVTTGVIGSVENAENVLRRHPEQRGVSGSKNQAWGDHQSGSTSSKYPQPLNQVGKAAELGASPAVLVASWLGPRPRRVVLHR